MLKYAEDKRNKLSFREVANKFGALCSVEKALLRGAFLV